MTDIMQKGCSYCDPFTVCIRHRLLRSQFPFDNLNQHSSGVKYSDAMSEPCMGGPWKNVLGHAQLLYPPETLEFRSVQQLPSELIDNVVRLKHDQAVDWITKAESPSHVGTYRELN